MILPIVHDPSRLKTPASPADPQQDAALAREMLATLAAHRAECLGMAANMVGENKALIVVTLGPIDLALFNPRLTKTTGPYQTEEGCLSLDGTRATKRFQRITVAYQDQAGKSQTMDLSGLAAEIVQHEIDHLNGILI